MNDGKVEFSNFETKGECKSLRNHAQWNQGADADFYACWYESYDQRPDSWYSQRSKVYWSKYWADQADFGKYFPSLS